MKIKVLIIVIVLFMLGCSQSEGITVSTPTDRVLPTAVPQEIRTKTTGAEVAIWQATLDARPTPTKDNRSDFEKCVQSGAEVKYVISGEDVSAVSVTWGNDTGGTNQGDYKLPFCVGFNKFQSGDFLYISAQIIQGEGSIVCKIYEGNRVIAEAKASGFPSIATCSASK